MCVCVWAKIVFLCFLVAVCYSLVRYSVMLCVSRHLKIATKCLIILFQPNCRFFCVCASRSLIWFVWIEMENNFNGMDFFCLVNACFKHNAFNPPIGSVWQNPYMQCADGKSQSHIHKQPKIYDEKQQQPTFEWTNKQQRSEKYGKFNETTNKPEQQYTKQIVVIISLNNIL